jgi:hypothetical protein
VASWTDDVLTILSLASRGVMVLIDHADDAHLRELFLAVREAHPTADVVLTPEALFDAAPGSVVVYLPLAEHADALNAGRPLVAERELKVLLWCHDETTLALATKAPDFYDWISHVVECPRKPAPWVVATFRCAMEYPDVPGVVWLGDSSPEEGIEAAGGKVTRRISVKATPEEMVAAAGGDREGWLWFEEVDAQTMIEVRWACAEARRMGRTVVSGRGLRDAEATAGWWRLDPRPADIRKVIHDHGGEAVGEHPWPKTEALVLMGIEPGSWKMAYAASVEFRDVAIARSEDPAAFTKRLLSERQFDDWSAVSPDVAFAARAVWGGEGGISARRSFDDAVRSRMAMGEAPSQFDSWSARNELLELSDRAAKALRGQWRFLIESLLRGLGRRALDEPNFYGLIRNAPRRWRAWWLRSEADEATSPASMLLRGINALSRDSFAEANRWAQACLFHSAAGEDGAGPLAGPATALIIRARVDRHRTDRMGDLLPDAEGLLVGVTRTEAVATIDRWLGHFQKNNERIYPEVVAEIARLFLREGDLARADVLLNLLPEAFAHPAISEVRCELWFERGEHALLTRDAATLSPSSDEAQRVELLRIRSAIRHNDPTSQPALADLVATVSIPEATTREARILQAHAESLLSRGSTSDALTAAEQARTVFAERYDPTHPAVGAMLLLEGETLLRLGRYQQGRQRLEESVQMLSERLGRAHHTTLQARLLLAFEHRRAGTVDAAEAIDPLVAQITARLGSQHPVVRYLVALAEGPGPSGGQSRTSS